MRILFLAGIILALQSAAGAESVQLTSDGWSLHGTWQPAESAPPAPAVLILHGAAGDREDFAALASAAGDAGMHSLRLELRGHGESTNLGRFEPPYAENRHINDGAWKDIVVGIDWLRQQPGVTTVAVIAASYSGEQAALALREGKTRADAYVMFSPGDFQDASIDAVGPSGVPWLFVRTTEESPASLRWIDEIYELLPERAPEADVRVYAGTGHAAGVLNGRPQVATETVQWLSASLQAQNASVPEPTFGPVFDSYGPVFDVSDTDFEVASDTRLRAVFDAAAYTQDGTGINRELESVARFINMHAASGMPLENMELVVVLHGEALKSALVNDTYRERFGRDNENLELLQQLSAAGVRLVACGQSLGFRGFERSELSEPVEVALSAMTALTVLQADGYALLP